MYAEPGFWHGLMERLAEAFSAYAVAQVAAGADVIQLFDSWVGRSLRRPTTASSWRRTRPGFSPAVDAPTIHFATGATHLLDELRRAGGDVVGLDWRVPSSEGWETVGYDRGVQGNLEPALLLGPFERVAAETDRILVDAGRRPAWPHLQSRSRRAARDRSGGSSDAPRARARLSGQRAAA